MISMREAYEKIGANYDDACARLMGEEMLARFALKFLDDESMDKLDAAMAAGDAEGAFMAAHTLNHIAADTKVQLRRRVAAAQPFQRVYGIAAPAIADFARR